MALKASIPVPVEADYTVRKVILTDRYLVTGTVTGWVTILDLQNLPKERNTDPSVHQKFFQADRWWDLDCRDDTIATANENGTVTLWDVHTSSRKADLVGHTALVKVVLLPPNQQIIISGSKDASIIVWDAVSNQRRSTLIGHRERIQMLKTFDNTLVSTSDDGTVRVWDLTTDSCIHVFEGHNGGALAVEMNESRTLLAAGTIQGDVKIWDLDNGTSVAACHGHTKLPIQFSNAPDNVLISAAVDGTVRSWDWASGNLIRTLDAHNGQAVRGLIFTSKFMISGGNDGCLHVWDRETWQFRFDLRERGNVGNVYQVVKGGNLLAAALLHNGEEGTVVELWDLTGLEERELETKAE